MRHLVRFCLRIGYLPRWSWFVSRARTAVFVPPHPRDNSSGMDGYIDIGGYASPKQVEVFRRWWKEAAR